MAWPAAPTLGWWGVESGDSWSLKGGKGALGAQAWDGQDTGGWLRGWIPARAGVPSLPEGAPPCLGLHLVHSSIGRGWLCRHRMPGRQAASITIGWTSVRRWEGMLFPVAAWPRVVRWPRADGRLLGVAAWEGEDMGVIWWGSCRVWECGQGRAHPCWATAWRSLVGNRRCVQEGGASPVEASCLHLVL